MGDEGTVRVDLWIWSVRLLKTRSMATTACRAGHVRVNDERAKPSTAVKPGDEIRLRHDGRERIVIVQRIIRKRVGAPAAAECLIDKSPPPPPREALIPVGRRERGAGRPTKRDRRELERILDRYRTLKEGPADIEAIEPGRDEPSSHD
ncbi:RNA-binding S4 domain-containing protein [Actinomadura sp. 3N508]|uniref:RNA-binding S4 domain-containing protein n=1 Tax=Actinomadura sp. 3N508 TaxID=3375153 RepID=UPI0037AE2567